jgi:hypothetical protein
VLERRVPPEPSGYQSGVPPCSVSGSQTRVARPCHHVDNIARVGDSLLSSDVVVRMSTNIKGTEVAAAGVSGQAQRSSLFGPPLLLEGEDGAAYDELVGRICAAVRPADVIDEMFIADIVALEWEVLRWRRLKWTLIREQGLEALEGFLATHLDYDLYSEDFVDRLAEILQDNLPQDQANSAQTLAYECARNETDAVDKVNNVLTGIGRQMDEILDDAQAIKAKELVQEYVRGEREAVTLVTKLLTDAGMSMDTFLTQILGNRIDEIERIDRLAAIGETRRNAALREIDRRRVVLGEALRRSVQLIEDDADGVLELPAEGQNAA